MLAHYGTGAIMAVPGQDERDWEFAETFDLPIIRTVQPPKDFEGKAYTEEGPAINSDFLNGLNITEAKAKIIEWLEKNGVGKKSVNYKLRDWFPAKILGGAVSNHSCRWKTQSCSKRRASGNFA